MLTLGCGGGSKDPLSCAGYPASETSPYIFPFASGKRVTVSQGNCSSESHYGKSRYAYDFSVPLGTEIIASRAGEVITVVEHHPDNDSSTEGNSIEIRHVDGSIAIYQHLKQNSAEVEEGDLVKQGDLIAKSGNSGNSTGPHLHFAVYSDADSDQSIPISFNNLKNNSESVLREKSKYRAQ
ncbi:MAG: M23 family metallopeptidase [Bdellovibrionales bacterium]